MKNVVWWIIVILCGLSAIARFYEAGKGRYTKTEEPIVNLVSGFLNLVVFLWGLITLL